MIIERKRLSTQGLWAGLEGEAGGKKGRKGDVNLYSCILYITILDMM